VVQQWHERYTHDPASRWLRALISELFSASKGQNGFSALTDQNLGSGSALYPHH
jgi:hypothetical protein